MVFAGNVQFGVEFAPGSVDRAVASLRQQFSRVPDLEIGVNLSQDGVTRSLSAIRQQLNEVDDVRLGIDLGDSNRQLSSLSAELDRLSRSNADDALERINRELSEVRSNSRQAQQGVSGVNSAIAGLIAGATSFGLEAIAGGISRAGEAAVEFARDTAQIGTAAIAADTAFTTILGSATEAQRVLGELSDFAATTPFDLPGVREAGQQLLAFGFSTQELIPTLTAVGDVAAGVGVPFGELAEIYGRARVQNRLFAEDINQLTGRGIPIIGELADQFGVAEDQIKGLVETGQVSFANLERAFQTLTSEGGQFSGLLGDLSQTTQGQFSNLGDTITQFQEALFRVVDPVLGAGLQTISAALAEAGSESRALDILGASAQRLAESLQGNPELAERLGSAIADLADSGAAVAADILDQINEAVSNPENIERWADAITSAGEQISGFVGEVQAVIAVVEDLINAIDSVTFSDLSLENFQDNSQLVTFDGPVSRALGIGEFAFRDTESGLQNLTNLAQGTSNALSEAFEEIALPDLEVEASGVDEAIQASRELEQIQSRLANSDIERVNALAELAGQQLSAGDAAAARAQIEVDAARRAIEAQQEQIQILENQNPEANAQEIQRIENRIADARLEIAETLADERVRVEEEATRRIEEALSARERLNALEVQQVNIGFDIDSGALQDQLSVSQALADLDQSRINAAGQILEAQLAQARASEDFEGIESARDRLLLNQLSSVQASFNAQRQQLTIQRQLASLDGQRQIALANIARSEAEIAVERARSNQNTTDAELQGLQAIVELRSQEVERTREAIAAQAQVLDIQSEQLAVDQSIAEQQAINQRRQEALESALERQNDLLGEQRDLEGEITDETERRKNAIDSIVSALGGLEDVAAEDALSNLDRLEENLRLAQRFGAVDGDTASGLQSQINRAQTLARGDFTVEEAFRFSQQNPDNQFTQSILDSLGFGGVTALSDAQQEIILAEGQITQLTTKLDDVKTAIEDLEIPAGIENLTVSTPDPVVDAATVTAQVNRRRRIAQGVI